MERPRYFYRQEVDERDGLERRVTVAYQYNSETGETYYGASIFRRDWPGESYEKSKHRTTAENRLAIRPVGLALEAGLPLPAVEERIRAAIRTYGVRGSRRHKMAEPKDVPEGAVICYGLDPNWPGNRKLPLLD